MNTQNCQKSTAPSANSRVPVIVGNWKMNNTISEALNLVKTLYDALVALGDTAATREIIVAPSYTALAKVCEFLQAHAHASPIKVAAQDIFWEDSGAYTGAIAGAMIKDAGVTHVIIGHSERRQYFAETDATVNKKTHAALRHNLISIVCVGETLSEREAGKVEEVVERQIVQGLTGISGTQLVNAGLIVAYEPVWAIGTGKTATPQQAAAVHTFIRGVLAQNFTKEVADKMRILYGGSVKPDNSKELLSQDNIDGALVGGASLKAVDFLGIIKNSL